MNLLFSCIGKRGYIARYFREHLAEGDLLMATSNTVWTPGFAAVDRAFLLPGYRDAGYGPAFLELCQKEKVNGVLSFMDEDVAILSRLRPELENAGIISLLPKENVAWLSFDKWEAFQFFLQEGIDTPMTFRELTPAVAALATGELCFPLVVKPRHGFGSRHTFVARSMDELRVFFAYEPDMLIQEFVEGDAYNFDLFCDLEGKPLAIVPWRKFQSRVGETEQAVTVESPALLEFGVQLATLLGKLGHVGPMDVDLFVSGDRISVLELNPRFGGGYPASHLAGADFPELAVRLLRGERVEPRIGRYCRGAAMLKDILPIGGELEHFGRTELHLGDAMQALAIS